MKLPNEVTQYLKAIGRKGGSAKGPTKARPSEMMRRIALASWAKRKERAS